MDYTSAEPLAQVGALFRLRVDGLRARFEMLEHFATERDARAVVDPFIRQWEFDTTLDRGPDTFTLVFHHAEVVGRRPPPGSRGDLGLRIVARAGVPTARMNLPRRYALPVSTGDRFGAHTGRRDHVAPLSRVPSWRRAPSFDGVLLLSASAVSDRRTVYLAPRCRPKVPSQQAYIGGHSAPLVRAGRGVGEEARGHREGVDLV